MTAACAPFLGAQQQAQATGGRPPESVGDFAANKLEAGNVGFDMLKQAGWQEGKGLGAGGLGSVNPVDMA